MAKTIWHLGGWSNNFGDRVLQIATSQIIRDAYKKVGMDIEAGNFSYETSVNHTHEGSIGNLCTEEISRLMDAAIDVFNFKLINNSLKELLE